MSQVPEPRPPASLTQVAMGVIDSVRGQPVMLGFLLVTLFITYIAWQLSIEGRKMHHLEARLLLERCLPTAKVP